MFLRNLRPSGATYAIESFVTFPRSHGAHEFNLTEFHYRPLRSHSVGSGPSNHGGSQQ